MAVTITFSGTLVFTGDGEHTDEQVGPELAQSALEGAQAAARIYDGIELTEFTTDATY